MEKRKINTELLGWLVRVADVNANQKIIQLMRDKGENCDTQHTLEVATTTYRNLMLISAHTTAVILSDKTVEGCTFFVQEHDCTAGVILVDEEANTLSSLSENSQIFVSKELLKKFEGAKMKTYAMKAMSEAHKKKESFSKLGSKSPDSSNIAPLIEKYRNKKIIPDVLKGYDKALYEYVKTNYILHIEKRFGKWYFVKYWRIKPFKQKKK